VRNNLYIYIYIYALVECGLLWAYKHIVHNTLPTATIISWTGRLLRCRGLHAVHNKLLCRSRTACRLALTFFFFIELITIDSGNPKTRSVHYIIFGDTLYYFVHGPKRTKRPKSQRETYPYSISEQHSNWHFFFFLFSIFIWIRVRRVCNNKSL